MASLPVEILELIIVKAADSKSSLKKYALVGRKWALIANSHLWREVILHRYPIAKSKESSFYKHVTKHGYVCGKYIQKLTLGSSKLPHTHIIKILRACPNIVDLNINYYAHYSNYNNKGRVNNFLEQIQILLPKLRKINLEHSHYEITGIEKLIADRKDLEILATRECNRKEHSFVGAARYNGKEWGECHHCISDKVNENFLRR